MISVILHLDDGANVEGIFFKRSTKTDGDGRIGLWPCLLHSDGDMEVLSMMMTTLTAPTSGWAHR
jgi:hypothetical protein